MLIYLILLTDQYGNVTGKVETVVSVDKELAQTNRERHLLTGECSVCAVIHRVSDRMQSCTSIKFANI